MVDRNRNFVSDGANLEHFIEESPFHGELSIEFRPSTRLERGDFLRKIGKLADQGKHAEAERETDLYVRSRLVSWSAVDTQGIDLPISPEAISRMEPSLFEKMFNCVLGLTPAVAKRVEADVKN